MKRVFLDMDGVLCEYRENDTVEDMHRDGYFRDLAPRSSMLDAVKYLMDSGKAEVFVLSAVFPERQTEATAEKNDWLNKHLPAIDNNHRIFTLCGTAKSDAVKDLSESDILCDDYSDNLFAWQRAGGKAVKILNEINGKKGRFVSGPRLRILGKEELCNTVLAM